MEIYELIKALPKGPDPSTCRAAIDFARKKEIRDLIRHIAISLHKHMRNTEIWRGEFCKSNHSEMLYWVMRVDGLGKWQDYENLYYIICFHIIVLHQNTVSRLSSGLSKPDSLLHTFGDRGLNSRKVSIATMIRYLLKCWDGVMEPVVIAGLDAAIDAEEDDAAKENRREWIYQFQPDHSTGKGILDVYSMPPNNVVAAVKERHKACLLAESIDEIYKCIRELKVTEVELRNAGLDGIIRKIYWTDAEDEGYDSLTENTKKPTRDINNRSAHNKHSTASSYNSFLVAPSPGTNCNTPLSHTARITCVEKYGPHQQKYITAKAYVKSLLHPNEDIVKQMQGTSDTNIAGVCSLSNDTGPLSPEFLRNVDHTGGSLPGSSDRTPKNAIYLNDSMKVEQRVQMPASDWDEDIEGDTDALCETSKPWHSAELEIGHNSTDCKVSSRGLNMLSNSQEITSSTVSNTEGPSIDQSTNQSSRRILALKSFEKYNQAVKKSREKQNERHNYPGQSPSGFRSGPSPVSSIDPLYLLAQSQLVDEVDDQEFEKLHENVHLREEYLALKNDTIAPLSPAAEKIMAELNPSVGIARVSVMYEQYLELGVDEPYPSYLARHKELNLPAESVCFTTAATEGISPDDDALPDIEELRRLFDEYPEIQKAKSALLNRWLEDNLAQVPDEAVLREIHIMNRYDKLKAYEDIFAARRLTNNNLQCPAKSFELSKEIYRIRPSPLVKSDVLCTDIGRKVGLGNCADLTDGDMDADSAFWDDWFANRSHSSTDLRRSRLPRAVSRLNLQDSVDTPEFCQNLFTASIDGM